MGDVVSLAGGGWQTQYQRDLFGLETGRTFSGGVRIRAERDRTGRVTSHKTEKNSRSLKEKNYLWGTNDKLLAVIADGEETRYEYDGWGNLSKTLFEDGKVEYRNPDKSGNLFESLDRMDRKYAKGGQLIKTQNWEYKYDQEGNLVKKKDRHGQTWRYEWNAAGMLSKVKRPDAREVIFKYDALGRRIEKRFGWNITKWVWDGNVPLHEQKETHTQDYEKDRGYFTQIDRQPLVTWVFEEGTFVPTAKLTQQKKLSIVTNYMGTPEAMYDSEGKKSWSCKLSSYGRVRNFEGQYKTECPFRYQGQYEDAETGLYYNRFRYYSPEEGMYISQDPIRLSGGFALYSYVKDTNAWIDPFGLEESCSENDDGEEEEPEGGVYILRDPEKDNAVVRAGRTKDLERREQEHASAEATKNLTFETVYRTDDYNEQRGLEHKVYEQHEGTASKENGGLNRIKAIGDTNDNKDTYVKAADDYLERNKE